MKKLFSAMLCICLCLSLFGCAGAPEETPGPGGEEYGVKAIIEGNLLTYYEMADGTWMYNDIVYEDRLEVRGRMEGAACDYIYVYLSNVPITFEQAWKSAGLGDDPAEFLKPEEAVLVEFRTLM